jgi:hypothetical protein
MPKGKTTRFKLPKAKLLEFNPRGKSIAAQVPTAGTGAEFAEKLWDIIHRNCSTAEWAMIKAHFEMLRAHCEAETARLQQQLERLEDNGGTAS